MSKQLAAAGKLQKRCNELEALVAQQAAVPELDVLCEERILQIMQRVREQFASSKPPTESMERLLAKEISKAMLSAAPKPAQAENARLREELVAARKDAERYLGMMLLLPLARRRKSTQ